jgi:hypothetical protein
MKALVNELSPINCLPPEVISAVPKYWPTDSQGDLIRATHVCRYWRTTIVASPSLWNVVKSGNEARMRAFIHRSQPYPLSMEIKHPGQEDVLSDAVFIRLKFLTLNLPIMNLARPLGRLISPTPMLEEFSITRSDSGDYLPVLKTGDFFMLSKLHMDGVSSNLAHLPVPHLTILHLENLQNNPRMSDLLQFLERTPWLEQLVLVNAGPEGDREPPERVIGLRSLQALTLHGTVVKAKLLQHLAIPVSANISLIGRFNQRLEGFMEEFLPPYLDSLPVTSTFTSLSIKSTSGSSCGMEFSGNEGKLNITIKNENHRGILGHGRLTPPTANLCLQRLTPLVLDTVTHLILRDSWGQQAFPESFAFREFLHQFPSLQSVDLVHCDFNSIRAFDPVGVNLPFFHSLNIYVAPDTNVDLDLLSYIARSRSLLQCPLERVKFVFGAATRVMFMESEMDRLKEHVPVIEVEEVDENDITSVF